MKFPLWVNTLFHQTVEFECEAIILYKVTEGPEKFVNLFLAIRAPTKSD